MGSYTYGTLDVQLSRSMTDTEQARYIQWASALSVAELDGDFNPYEKGYGDIGLLAVEPNLLSFQSEGKVYDIEQKVEKLLAGVPPNIECSGEAIFETEGEHWAIRIVGREARVLGAGVRIEEEDAAALIRWLREKADALERLEPYERLAIWHDETPDGTDEASADGASVWARNLRRAARWLES